MQGVVRAGTGGQVDDDALVGAHDELAAPAGVGGEVAGEDVPDLRVAGGQGPHDEAHLTAPPVTPAAM